MCGRITQTRTRRAYAEALGWVTADTERNWYGGDLMARYNVAPGTWPWLMHRFHENTPAIDTVFWGYRPGWAKDRKLPIAINATIEKANAAYWKSLWKSGRAIVPADGWYEWTGEKGNKQPWYIRQKEDKPLFLAALTTVKPYTGEENLTEQNGFAIVTAAAEGGLIDVHDRRPVVLSPKDANLWLDQGISPEQAGHLARLAALGPDCFEWHKVSTAVNKVGHNDPLLVSPID